MVHYQEKINTSTVQLPFAGLWNNSELSREAVMIRHSLAFVVHEFHHFLVHCLQTSRNEDVFVYQSGIKRVLVSEDTVNAVTFAVGLNVFSAEDVVHSARCHEFHHARIFICRTADTISMSTLMERKIGGTAKAKRRTREKKKGGRG